MNSLQFWFSSIWRVLIKPTPDTFTEISNEVEDIFGQSVFLLSGATTLSFIVLITQGYFEKAFYLNLIGTTLFLILFSLLFTYFINTLKGKIFQNQVSCYEQLYFSIVVIILLTTFLDLLLILLLPGVSFLGYMLLFYAAILLIISIKSLTKLPYWQTIITLVLSAILATLSAAIVGFFLARLIQIIPYWFMYY